MSTSEIDGAQRLQRNIQTFTGELQQVLHDVGGRIIGNGIKPSSAQRYACILIQRVNRNVKGSEGQKQRTRTGMIKVLGFIHNRAKKSDPRFA